MHECPECGKKWDCGDRHCPLYGVPLRCDECCAKAILKRKEEVVLSEYLGSFFTQDQETDAEGEGKTIPAAIDDLLAKRREGK